MELTEEDLNLEWRTWGDTKPWYCPKCNSLLAPDVYKYCDGDDQDLPEEQRMPHDRVEATSSISFEEFVEIQAKWEKEGI